MAESERPYHHGDLRRTAVEATVAEVLRVGAAGVRMREVARRAGVTHAALAYQFGDKAGLFTAVAVEGFRLSVDTIGPAAVGRDGFFDGGIAYIGFAMLHPGHFEVMFRPDLYRAEDPELIAARDAAFAVLYGSARASLGRAATEDDLTGTVLAGWSLSHGFAMLARSGNLEGRLGDDPGALTELIARGIVRLSKLAARHLAAVQADGSLAAARNRAES